MTGPQVLFEGPGSKKLIAANVPDGLGSTALLFEAGQPVPWTKPADLIYAPGSPLPPLRESRRGYLVAFADGSVRSIPSDADEQTLRALITPRGGESVLIDRSPKNRYVVELTERVEQFRSGLRR